MEPDLVGSPEGSVEILVQHLDGLVPRFPRLSSSDGWLQTVAIMRQPLPSPILIITQDPGNQEIR